MRQLKLALVIAPLILAGCGAWHDLFGSKNSAASQPLNCSRAPLEDIIARAGMACDASNPCPSGSFCNTSGICTWACYTDSECATGQVCGCDGQCTGSTGGGVDGGPSTTDQSCNKDATLLYKIKPGSSPTNIPPDLCDANGHCPLNSTCDTTSNICNWVRACDNDERCPAGSYCDPATGNCSWDCQPNVACPDPAQTCDCTGRCVVPGVTPTMGQSGCEARQTFTMGVSTRTSLLIADPNDPTLSVPWTRTVSLSLSTPIATGAQLVTRNGGLVLAAQTYVVPRDNLQIFCNGAYTSSPCPLPLTGANFGVPPSTDAWQIDSPGSTTRATILLQFQSVAGVPASSWHADIYTPGAGNSPESLDFTFNTLNSPAPDPQPAFGSGPPSEGNYSGTMVLTGATDNDPGTPPTGTDTITPASVPIFATAARGFLTIFDPSRTISNSGTLTVTSGNRFYLGQINDAQLDLAIHGDLLSLAINAHNDSQGVTTGIQGSFTVSVGTNSVAAYTGTLSLTPVTNSQGFPNFPSEPQPPFGEPNYQSTPLNLNAYKTDFYQSIEHASDTLSTWENNLYDYHRGVAAIDPDGALAWSPVSPMVGGDDLVDYYPRGGGLALCQNDFMKGYVSALSQVTYEDSNQREVDISADLERYDQPFADVCNNNVAFGAVAVPDQWAACLGDSIATDVIDIPLADLEDELQGLSGGGLSSAASCQRLYANENKDSRSLPDAKTWLNTVCINVAQALAHHGGNTDAGRLTVDATVYDLTVTPKKQIEVNHLGTFEMYICPSYRTATVRLPFASDGKDPTFGKAVLAGETSPAEAAFCYEPGHAGPLLWSGRLTDGTNPGNVLSFSGDLLCQDDNGRTWVPAMFPLLTHADRDARGELVNGDPLNASDLLDVCLNELSAPAPTLTDSDLSSGSIIETVANVVFGDAKCVSMSRFAGAMNYFKNTGAGILTVQDQKLLTHFLREWAQVHSFISYEGLQESNLRQVLSSATQATTSPVMTSGTDPGSLPPLRYEDLIDLVNKSWEPFLTEYNNQRPYLAGAIPDPDYRDVKGGVAAPSDAPSYQDQSLPLPVTEMEGLVQEMRLLKAYLTQAALAAYSADPTAPNPTRDQALTRYGATMRLGYLVEGAANDLFNSGAPGAAVDRWNTALGDLHGLREDVRRLAGKLGAGLNPLGIDEDDLPIYFGDPSGVNSQYFASSDYLLNQWAVPAVTAAEASITAARDAWIQARNSAIQDLMSQAQRDQRVDDLKSTQGQKIIDNCGLTNVASQDVLAALQGGAPDGTQIDLSTCFIDPTCLAQAGVTSGNIDNVTANVSPQQINFTLCTLNQTAGYRELPQPIATCASTGNINAGCKVSDLYQDYNSGLVPPSAAQQAAVACQALLGYNAPLPAPQDLVGSLDPSCYRGKLGAAALQIIAARQDIDIARKQWEAAQNTFQLDTTNCEQVEQSEDGAIERAQDLANTLQFWTAAKFQADQAALLLDAEGSLFGGIISAVATDNPGAAVSGAFSAGADAFKEQSLEAQNQMDMAQQQYNEAQAIQQATDAIRACWHEVDLAQLPIPAAFAQIQRRGTDATSAIEQFKTAMNENLQALRQGTADVKREQNRLVSTVAFHYWVSDKIDRFEKDFGWAQRMVYLAMRAVEYEFQQSLGLRSTILTASHPDQLLDAINALQQEQGTRTINRRRPSEDSIVLSLRDDVLGLRDQSSDPMGEKQLTPTRGLQQRLTDPKFAVSDTSGNWLGQGIPFSLGPSGALNDRCGERLWQITATVQGDALSDDQPGVSLLVLKRNTFASQWCQGLGDGSKFQYGSLQPNRNLFAQNGTSTPDSESNGFSTALIYPWFNIRRTDFYKQTYQDGASQELAGRGLYGDYVLLFPKDVLEGTGNNTNACVSVQSGFPLAQVEDVLIRFDYLSVDNLPAIAQ